MEVNFSQRAIVDKTRANFVAIALDIWGDLEVTWTDGRPMTEKQLARQLKVQFTPTLLFLDEQGRIDTRLNGYWPPHRFEAALDYVRHAGGAGLLAEYLERNAKEAARDELNDEPFLMKPPFDLRRQAGGKPLAVLFETPLVPRLRRDACRRLPAHRDARVDPALRHRALRARRRRRAHHAQRAPAHRGGVGARAEGELHAHRSCSSTTATARSSARRLPAAVPPDRCVRLRGAAAPTARSRSSSASCRTRPSGCASRGRWSISGVERARVRKSAHGHPRAGEGTMRRHVPRRLAPVAGPFRHAATGRPPGGEALAHRIHRRRQRVHRQPGDVLSSPLPTPTAGPSARTRAACRASCACSMRRRWRFRATTATACSAASATWSTNPRVGLLFIDFERPRRLRVQGRATLSSMATSWPPWPGAQCVVRVRAERIFPNCPRYIHRMQRLETVAVRAVRRPRAAAGGVEALRDVPRRAAQG